MSESLHAELKSLEIAQRAIIRGCAYFGSHRGYNANEARILEIRRQLNGGYRSQQRTEVSIRAEAAQRAQRQMWGEQ